MDACMFPSNTSSGIPQMCVWAASKHVYIIQAVKVAVSKTKAATVFSKSPAARLKQYQTIAVPTVHPVLK